ncbi:Lrp/AsnC ligand binding domain-containing protein [Candidatus Bathyarchaeota archaeon]|nr:Lrp/AsnC ligand binding domain-containing protein [Candidatus Bathyarchaeota archaeon]
MDAYILVNTDPGKIWDVAEKALEIKGVKMAHAVTGEFDVVIHVEFAKTDALSKIIKQVQAIKGVRKTQTLIAVPRPVRE